MTVRELNISLPIEPIRDFCRHNPIQKLRLFGSALRDDFNNQSDVDLLVEFLPDQTPGLIKLLAMQHALERLIGRRVDLRTPNEFNEQSRARLFAEAEVLFPAKTDADHLRDILRFAEEAIGLVQSKARTDLGTDKTLSYALQHCFTIIGEAASRLSDATRTRMPGIPWHEIIGMRNWIVHQYERVDLEVLWKTTQEDLPKLIGQILDLLPPEQI